MSLNLAHAGFDVTGLDGPIGRMHLHGITGPGGVLPADPSTFTPDLVKHDDRIIFDVTLRL